MHSMSCMRVPAIWAVIVGFATASANRVAVVHPPDAITVQTASR